MTILNVNSDILTPPSLTLNTFGTMQPVIKATFSKNVLSNFYMDFHMKQQYQYMQGSKNSRPGGWIQGVSVIKKIFVLNLFYRSHLVYFKENFNFPWFQRGSINSSSGKDGVQLFPEGGGGVSRCLIIPYLSPYNLCFQGGLVSPLDPSMQYLDYLDAVTKVRYLKKLSILNLPEYMVSGKTAIEA